MPHEEFPEDDIFGEYSYLTYMAQHASKGAPLPVFWNMSEEKSGNFEKAMDDYIGMSGHNDADPLAEYEATEDFEDPNAEEEWWAFDTFFGSALQDSFDTMEDGNMEQGLDGVDDIVSSAILTYDAQPGSFAKLDPPFPIPASMGPPMAPEPPPGLLDVPGSVPPEPGLWESLFGSLYAKPVGADAPMTNAEVFAALEGVKDKEEQLTASEILDGALTSPDPLGYIQKMIREGVLESDIQDWVGSPDWGGTESLRNDLIEAGLLPKTKALEEIAKETDQQQQDDSYWYERRLPDGTVLNRRYMTVREAEGYPDWYLSEEQGPPPATTGTEGAELTEEEIKEGLKKAKEKKEGIPTERPSYMDQFRGIFNTLPGSQRFEAQSGMLSMFDDAETLFYLTEDWSNRDWLAGEKLQAPSLNLDEKERKKEEQIFANWVQDTYFENPKHIRFGAGFYDEVRDLRDRMFQIKDLTMEELYETLTGGIEKDPGYALGDLPFPKKGRYPRSPSQGKKTVMDRFVFMDPENEQSSRRLAKLVGMYNIHPGADHWLKTRMMGFYSNMMKNWLASGRDSYDFIRTFVKDKPAMPGGGEAPSTDGYQDDYVRPYFGPESSPVIPQAQPTVVSYWDEDDW